MRAPIASKRFDSPVNRISVSRRLAMSYDMLNDNRQVSETEWTSLFHFGAKVG